MKINELSKQLTDEVGYEVKNGDLISYLKEQGFKVSSHMQNATDEMVESAKEHFVKVEKTIETTTKNTKVEKKNEPKKDIVAEIPPTKVFKPDDIIVCRSVTPWKLNALGVNKSTVYHWSGYGDVDYLTYRDLQALRRSEYITKPKIIIEDPDLCYQWRRELGDTYKYFLGVEYPEEFFDKSDYEFEELLRSAPNVVKEVIKVTAMNMIKNENYPTIQKIRLIDDILGTCLKDFV